MYKHLLGFLFIFSAMFAVSSSHSNAESGFSGNEEVYKFLQEAFQAQVSLSEKERSLEEVMGVLDPYFSETAKETFLNANLISENEKHIIYGSDAASFYIPFFSYSNDTKVVEDKDKIYVYEYFPGTQEGPVGYESHYEGILLEKEKGKMKIVQFLDENIPDLILEKADKEQNTLKASFKTSVEPILFNNPSYQFSFLLSPFDAFLRTGGILLTNNQAGGLALFQQNELNSQLASN
ncbi:DUF3993 domain-containing protein [Cytobacillus sp. NCCP-133]|uniref:DUF3993 domain-containing protein n=1 Tax=Cytobacillus sp. NCCP-133 TaxID=766848 RepID=UPI002232AC93|nr:DUF3993 domain-containing protein [Cytobacillus sp. NCCP-133]GLB60393.1 hypothetical protein NCCP133_25250 [Cytobacillus sp. NCCP-133]